LSLLRNVLLQAARRAANDPQVRERAGEVAREEAVPRLKAARDELKDLAAEARASDEPHAFLRLLGRRVGQVNRRGRS
jgi:hypothetical protein